MRRLGDITGRRLGGVRRVLGRLGQLELEFLDLAPQFFNEHLLLFDERLLLFDNAVLRVHAENITTNMFSSSASFWAASRCIPG